MRTALAILGFAVLIGSAVLAADEPAISMSKGEVVSWDAKLGVLTVDVESTTGEKTKMDFQIDLETKIIKGSKKIGLVDLTAGDNVTINFTQVEGKNHAVSIGVQPQV